MIIYSEKISAWSIKCMWRKKRRFFFLNLFPPPNCTNKQFEIVWLEKNSLTLFWWRRNAEIRVKNWTCAGCTFSLGFSPSLNCCLSHYNKKNILRDKFPFFYIKISVTLISSSQERIWIQENDAYRFYFFIKMCMRKKIKNIIQLFFGKNRPIFDPSYFEGMWVT